MNTYGESLVFSWVPSHIDVQGNEKADELAEKGRRSHPFNTEEPPLKCSREGWEALGLEEMVSEYSDASESGSGESFSDSLSCGSGGSVHTDPSSMSSSSYLSSSSVVSSSDESSDLCKRSRV